jgi:3-methyladenine DNA glycosylase AlkD
MNRIRNAKVIKVFVKRLKKKMKKKKPNPSIFGKDLFLSNRNFAVKILYRKLMAGET